MLLRGFGALTLGPHALGNIIAVTLGLALLSLVPKRSGEDTRDISVGKSEL